MGGRNNGKNRLIIDLSESVLRDVQNEEIEFKEVLNVISYDELAYLTHCARQFYEVYESSTRVMKDMTEEYERMKADRDYWKEKFLLSQRQ